jgi:hypothetical protein
MTVSSCPGQAKLPVTFQIDCSHLRSPFSKQLCGRFIENQACRVFPAYREITGINLEETCRSIKYTIYEHTDWPHGSGEGGVTLKCTVDYLAEYSIGFRSDSSIGPYDVHELLHVYHDRSLGALPAMHILFGPSMLEATRVIGDVEEYERHLQRMRDEAQSLREKLRKGTVSVEDRCRLAQTVVEENLYLENRKRAYLFYRTLEPDKGILSQADREARFNRMFYAVSGRKDAVRQFLIDQGCGRF